MVCHSEELVWDPLCNTACNGSCVFFLPVIDGAKKKDGVRMTREVGNCRRIVYWVKMLFFSLKAPLQLIVFLVSFFHNLPGCFMKFIPYSWKVTQWVSLQCSFFSIDSYFLLPPQAHVSSRCTLFTVHTKPISSNSITNLFLPYLGIDLLFLYSRGCTI